MKFSRVCRDTREFDPDITLGWSNIYKLRGGSRVRKENERRNLIEVGRKPKSTMHGIQEKKVFQEGRVIICLKCCWEIKKVTEKWHLGFSIWKSLVNKWTCAISGKWKKPDSWGESSKCEVSKQRQHWVKICCERESKKQGDGKTRMWGSSTGFL